MGLQVTAVGADNHVIGGDRMRPGDLAIEIRGTGNVIEFGPALKVEHTASMCIAGDGNRITLGAACSLGGGSMIRVEGSDSRLAVGDRCSGTMRINVLCSGTIFDMGDHCTMVGAQFALHEPARMTLGRDCMISAGVFVTVSDMHAVVDLETGERINPARSVRLGDHVWLGARVMVLKGVEIGTGSIIGAGAVVSRSVPANSMAVGVPARVVRRQVSWHRKAYELAGRVTDTLDVATPGRS